MSTQIHPFRRWRAAVGKTLTEVARCTDTAQPYLSQIEIGSKVPSIEMAARLAIFTGGEIAIEDFLPTEIATQYHRVMKRRRHAAGTEV